MLKSVGCRVWRRVAKRVDELEAEVQKCKGMSSFTCSTESVKMQVEKV